MMDSKTRARIFELLGEDVPSTRRNLPVIAVVGEYNAGKTTFMNALIGQALLPTGMAEVTGVIHRVRHGKKIRFRVDRGDSEVGEWIDDLEKLADFRVDRIENENELSLISHIFIESPGCPEGLEFVDTPGTNSVSKEREKMLLEILPEASALIFLSDCKQSLKGSELPFLQKYVFGDVARRTLVVISKFDLLKTKLDQEQNKKALLERISQIWKKAKSPSVFFISGYEALKSEGKDSFDFESLLSAIRELSKNTDRMQDEIEVVRTADSIEEKIISLKARITAHSKDLHGLSEDKKALLNRSKLVLSAMISLSENFEEIEKRVLERLRQEVASRKLVVAQALRAGGMVDFSQDRLNNHLQEITDIVARYLGECLIEKSASIGNNYHSVLDNEVRKIALYTSGKAADSQAESQAELVSKATRFRSIAVGASIIGAFVNPLLGMALGAFSTIQALGVGSDSLKVSNEIAGKAAEECLEKYAHLLTGHLVKTIKLAQNQFQVELVETGNRIIWNTYAVTKGTTNVDVSALESDMERCLSMKSWLQKIHKDLAKDGQS